MYVCIYIYIYTHIYTYMYREREVMCLFSELLVCHVVDSDGDGDSEEWPKIAEDPMAGRPLVY